MPLYQAPKHSKTKVGHLLVNAQIRAMVLIREWGLLNYSRRRCGAYAREVLIQVACLIDHLWYPNSWTKLESAVG